MKTARNIYRRFIEFEEKAADIYFKLTSRFSKDRQLSSFWLEMAMHEKQHAGLLQFCLKDGLFASDLPDNTEIQKVNALFKRLERRAADPKLTVEEAFSIAMELEASEVNAIYCHLTTTLHRSMYLFKRKIATSLPNHIEELVRTARKFNVKGDTKKELNRLKKHCSLEWRAQKAGSA